jgi:hypothetical protein
LSRAFVVVACLALGGAGRLPAQAPAVSGGIYLYQYQPLGLSGVEPKTEVYAAYVTLDRRTGPWTVHVEARARDSKLRPFYPGTVWFQEAWLGFHAATPSARQSVTLRAGKLYQRLGRFWDGSFFGNLQYFDGLKLNPQFGLEAVGRARVGRVLLGLSGQYLLSSDRVSGALAGRDFETLAGFRNRDGAAVRATASAAGATVGVSWLSQGVDTAGVVYRVPHVALDAAFTRGPATLYVEWARRRGGSLPAVLRSSIAGSAATWWLAGVQWNRGALHLRYNFSRSHYDALGRTEWSHQPGVTYDVAPGVHGLLEYDLWQTRVAGVTAISDRSLDAVLLLEFR